MAATRLICGVPGCNLGPEENVEGTPYQTVAHLIKIEETQKDMDQHLFVNSLILGVVGHGRMNPPTTENVRQSKFQGPN